MIIETIKMADDDLEDSLTDVADALIVTNLNLDFFDDDSAKEQFEAAFTSHDPDATFNYLKSFRRARVNFSSTEATVAARLERHNSQLCGQCIKCYFAPVPKTSGGGLLFPPKPEKMFLISPPCSPPVGWEQHPEAEPIINYELLEALSRLNPDPDEPGTSQGGEIHEVVPASDSIPGIVVHVCEDPEGYANRPTILQTRYPDRQ